MSAGASVEEAARNNAEWCDSFCRTHGINGRFDSDAWTSATRTPPLYPDAVTLVAGASVEAILLRVDTSVGCSIKDSFADLNLAPLGFDRLFAAEWLCQEQPRSVAAPHNWSMITRQDELEGGSRLRGSRRSRGHSSVGNSWQTNTWQFSHATRATQWSAVQRPTAVGP
jgi:hypothetical protein